jgi:hypothetical protein
VLVDGQPDRGRGIIHELGDELQGLGGHDARAFALAAPGLARGHGQAAAVGGDQAKLVALALEEHAVDGVAAVLDGGGEERPGDQRVQGAGLDLAVDLGVGEVPHRRKLRRVEAEDLEVRVGAADVDRVVIGLDGERRVLAGPRDLDELVGGNRRLAFLGDLDLLDAEAQAHLEVGGAEQQPCGLGVGSGELQALQDRRGRPAGHDAAGGVQRLDQRGTIADDLHGCSIPLLGFNIPPRVYQRWVQT